MFCNQQAGVKIQPDQHSDDVLRRLHKGYAMKEMVIVKDPAAIATLDGSLYQRGTQSIVTDRMGMPVDRDCIRDEINQFGSSALLVWSYPLSN